MEQLSKHDKLIMRKTWMRTLFDNPNNDNFGDRDIYMNDNDSIHLSFFEQKETKKFELYIRNRHLSSRDPAFVKERHLLQLFAELMLESKLKPFTYSKEEGKYHNTRYMFYFDSFDDMEEAINFSFELLEEAVLKLERNM